MHTRRDEPNVRRGNVLPLLTLPCLLLFRSVAQWRFAVCQVIRLMTNANPSTGSHMLVFPRNASALHKLLNILAHAEAQLLARRRTTFSRDRDRRPGHTAGSKATNKGGGLHPKAVGAPQTKRGGRGRGRPQKNNRSTWGVTNTGTPLTNTHTKRSCLTESVGVDNAGTTA